MPLPKLDTRAVRLMNSYPHQLTHDDLSCISAYCGRALAPVVLNVAWRARRVNTETLASFLTAAWGMTDSPLGRLANTEWRTMFFDARDHAPDKPDSLTLYRGSRYIDRYGWSWTTLPEVAEWYATGPRGMPKGSVWTIEANREEILWRGSELTRDWVVCPAGLQVKRYADRPADAGSARERMRDLIRDRLVYYAEHDSWPPEEWDNPKAQRLV